MPLFRQTVIKHFGAEKWSNVYHIEAADMAAAKTEGDFAVATERVVHTTDVIFDYYLLSEVGNPFHNFRHILITLAGQFVPTADTINLPLWNTVKCVFVGPTNDRPDFKQLRLPLYTDQITADGLLTTTKRNHIDAYYQAAIAGRGTFCNKTGQNYNGGATVDQVQDRDLNRRKRYPRHV